MQMGEDKLYQIGEVSKLCNISIKTLRYYDEIELLKPVKVDDFSNYRYYSCEQLTLILVIKYFKEAGFSLKQIKKLIERDNSEYIERTISEKCKEIDGKITDLLRIKQKLKFYSSSINSKDELNNKAECLVKYIPKMYIAYFRSKAGFKIDDYRIRYCKLISLIEKNNLHIVKNVMAIYYDDASKYVNRNGNDYDIEVCAEVSEKKEIPGLVRKFGGFKAVSLMIYGSYDVIKSSYKKIIHYIIQNGYEPCGPAIDNYIVDIISTCDENNYITEILVPIK